jgi:hypothetical protein
MRAYGRESGEVVREEGRQSTSMSGCWSFSRNQSPAVAACETGDDGSVGVVIRADGRELFRSETITDDKLNRVEVNVPTAKRLELATEDAGDGRPATGEYVSNRRLLVERRAL